MATIPVKILLVANYILDGQQSMQRFAAMMEHGLKEAGLEVTTLRPPVVFGAILRSSRGLGKWLGYADKFLLFPLILRKAARRCDVVHVCDHSNAIYLRYLQRVPNLVTCHDLLAIRSALGEFPANATGYTGRKFQKMILHGLSGARHLVCVSEATRSDVARIINCPIERLPLVYNGVNHLYRPIPREEAESQLRAIGVRNDTPYVLHVGNNSWYKNRITVLRIFSRLAHYENTKGQSLILVGPPCTDNMKRFIHEQKLEDKVRVLTNVSSKDLCALYSRADALLFPSLVEGFGWPIIEAQACGCPVVTSNRPPMTEVAGEAALFVDPEDVESSAETMARRWSELAMMRDLGFSNVQRFNTPAMIKAYVSAYQLACQECADELVSRHAGQSAG